MKKYLLLITTLAVLNCTPQNNSQAFDWAMNPGANTNNLYALHYDTQGNLLVMASASDSADFGGNFITALPSGGYPTTNYYVGRKNINGTSQVVVQSRNGANNAFTNFSDFVLDANDNIVVVGATSAGHDFGNGVTLSNKGYILAKYNSSGVAQWAKMYNFGNPAMSSFTTKPWHIQCLPNGHIVAILKEVSGRYAYIKLDANGNQLIYKEFKVGGTGSTIPVITSSKNNYFVDNSGAFYLYFNTVDMATTPKMVLSATTNSVNTPLDSVTITNAGHSGVSYLLAFRPDGTKKYFKGFRGSMLDLVTEQLTGNVLFYWKQYGGQNNIAPMNMISTNTGSFAQTYAGVMAIDSLGNYIKKSTETPTLQYVLESLLPLGNFKLIGTLKYANGNVLTAGAQTYSVNSGGFFTWYEYDASLTPSYFIAAPLYNQNNSLANDAISCRGNKVAVGFKWYGPTQSTVNINGTILKANNKNVSFSTRYNAPFNAVGNDIAIAQYDRTLQGTDGILEISAGGTGLRVYPNPAKDVINVEVKNQIHGNANISITNLLGQIIYKAPVHENVFSINISGFNPGIYSVNLESQSGLISTSKLIID